MILALAPLVEEKAVLADGHLAARCHALRQMRIALMAHFRKTGDDE
jgi:hypothetical protein